MLGIFHYFSILFVVIIRNFCWEEEETYDSITLTNFIMKINVLNMVF